MPFGLTLGGLGVGLQSGSDAFSRSYTEGMRLKQQKEQQEAENALRASAQDLQKQELTAKLKQIKYEQDRQVHNDGLAEHLAKIKLLQENPGQEDTMVEAPSSFTESGDTVPGGLTNVMGLKSLAALRTAQILSEGKAKAQVEQDSAARPLDYFGKQVPAYMLPTLARRDEQKQEHEFRLNEVFAKNTAKTRTTGILGDVPEGLSTGEQFLSELAPGQASLIRAYATGAVPGAGRGAGKLALSPEDVQKVMRYDPTWTPARFEARKKALSDFQPGGTNGKSIQALNTAVQHLGALAAQGADLGNTRFPSMNAIVNAGAEAVGSGKPGTYRLKALQGSEELENLWRQGGGSEGAIQAKVKELSPNDSPEAMKQKFAGIAELIGGKLTSIEHQRDQTLGPGGKNIEVISPQSRAILAKLMPQATAEAPAGKTVKRTGTLPDGRKVTLYDDGTSEVQ